MYTSAYPFDLCCKYCTGSLIFLFFYFITVHTIKNDFKCRYKVWPRIIWVFVCDTSFIIILFFLQHFSCFSASSYSDIQVFGLHSNFDIHGKLKSAIFSIAHSIDLATLILQTPQSKCCFILCAVLSDFLIHNQCFYP